MSTTRSAMDPLNQAGFNSLFGLSSDPPNAIVELLRSDVPLDLTVREALASAIEGTSPFGIRLKLEGHERVTKWSEGLTARRDWFAFGKKVAPFIAAAPNVPDGLTDAEQALLRPDSFCRKSYYYWRRCTDWKESARNKGKLYSAMTDSELETEFHLSSIEQKSDNPEPMVSADFDHKMAERLDAVRSLSLGFGENAELAAGVFYWLWRFPTSGV